MPKVRPMVDRFEEKFIPVTESGCWLWTGSGTVYGKLRSVGGKNSTWVSAHRLSYELYCGPIPKGLIVLHKCDTPLCVNPRHLFLGSHKDNTQDMRSKDRHSKYVPDAKRGTDNSNTKLTNQLVLQIRNDPRPSKLVAKDFGVCPTSIKNIRSGKTWRWL